MSKNKNQDVFQGTLTERNYFEGWYFKQVSQDGKTVLSIIPGISIHPDDPHCFIQIIESKNKKSYYIRYDIQDFSYTEDTFEVKIGKNYFSKERIHLEIKEKEFTLDGDLFYRNSVELEKTKYRPTIMGPFSYLKKMQCNHGVVSLYHEVEGIVYLNKKKLKFKKGTGYIEKDYGTSFPKKYIWIQSQNAVYHEKTTFMLSIADIPFTISSFEGLIGVLSTPEKQWVFATYYGCKVIRKIEEENRYILLLKQKDLHIKITCTHQTGYSLLAPKSGKMCDHVKECLEAEFVVEVYRKKKLFFFDRFLQAGFENVKDTSE